MEHNVKDVFKHSMIDIKYLKKFNEFVENNIGKYGLYKNEIYNIYTTTTLFSEDLIKAFKESIITKNQNKL